MPADARTELLRQIRTIRQRIDPDVLSQAAAAAQTTPMARAAGMVGGAGRTQPDAGPDMVPYDKEAARDAVMQFLQARGDRGRFALQLMERLKQAEQARDAYTVADHRRTPAPAKGKRV